VPGTNSAVAAALTLGISVEEAECPPLPPPPVEAVPHERALVAKVSFLAVVDGSSARGFGTSAVYSLLARPGALNPSRSLLSSDVDGVGPGR